MDEKIEAIDSTAGLEVSPEAEVEDDQNETSASCEVSLDSLISELDTEEIQDALRGQGADGNIDVDEVDGIEVDKLVGDFDVLKSQIAEEFKSDRKIIQSFIDYFEQQLKAGDIKNCYVEAIASLLSTKINASTSSVKVLDSIAKIISATKGIDKPKDIDLSGILDD